VTALSRLIVRRNTRKIGKREGKLAAAFQDAEMATSPSTSKHSWILQALFGIGRDADPVARRSADDP
jgi:hypothetical protein